MNGLLEKTVSIDVPSESQLKVPNNQKGLAQWKSAKQLTLNYSKQGPDEEWIVTEKTDEVEVKFGKGKLRRLQTAIAEIPKGKGDFAISDSDDENILYFWWNLEK